MTPSAFAKYAEVFAATCRDQEAAATPSEPVLEALGDVSREVVGLAARIRAARIVYADRDRGCDDPPDLDGLCLRCGRHIAPPVADHKQGCNPFDFLIGPIVRVRRLAVRVRRLHRCAMEAE